MKKQTIEWLQVECAKLKIKNEKLMEKDLMRNRNEEQETMRRMVEAQSVKIHKLIKILHEKKKSK